MIENLRGLHSKRYLKQVLEVPLKTFKALLCIFLSKCIKIFIDSCLELFFIISTIMIDSDCARQEVNHELPVVHLSQRCKSFRNLPRVNETDEWDIPCRNLNSPYI